MTAGQQREILERAPEPPEAIYEDVQPKRRKAGAPALPERERLTRSLRAGAGDVVLVADEGVLGRSWDDTLAAAAKLAERGAVLRIARTGQEYAYQPRDAEVMDFFRLGDSLRKKRRAEHARAVLNKMGKGGVPALLGAKKEAARKAWFDPKKSGAEAAKEFGVSRTTMHNTFGPRNTPDVTQRGRPRK